MDFRSQFNTFHTMASKAAGGLNDFGPDDYHEPLSLLLSDYDKYPVYNEMGLNALAEQIVGMLVGRLMLFQGLKNNPAALEAPIERPIFIIGMPRTGTTVLHKVLTQDPRTQSMPFWLGNVPMPRPPRDTWEAHPIFQQVKQGLETSPMVTESSRAIHPVYAEQADECRWMLDQTLWSSTAVLSTDTPNYCDWFENTDARYAYEYHKKVLSLVANGDTRRWVLKDPSHMNGIDALLAVYPDACIVQTHREPVDCMRSVTNLTWEARSLREPGLTQEVIGTVLTKIWSTALRNMESVRRKRSSSQFLDIHISETRTDIIGTIERIFDYFHLPVTDEAHQSWEKQLASDPNAGHLEKHTPPDFGISKAVVNEAVGDYHERYLQVCDNAGVKVT